jgi:tRNA G18 (ribose-2'-O)-methylase SpoU
VQAGFEVMALSTDPRATPLEEVRGRGRRLAILLGSEGYGLSPAALARATLQARIPMAAGVDSLNVATTAGIALYVLSRL